MNIRNYDFTSIDSKNPVESLIKEERRFIARELHDQLSQHLTAMNLFSESIIQITTLPTVRSHALAISKLITESRSSVKSVIKGLRGQLPTGDTFITSICELLTSWQKQNTDLQASLKIEGSYCAIQHDIIEAAYRIVQEAVTNIHDHAHAKEVYIQIAHRDQSLSIKIKDDGIGLNTEQPHHGYGIIGMKERVKILNGVISIKSKPHYGTDINVLLPT